MALPLASDGFRDIFIVLGASGLIIPAFTALRISPVVGFILVGIVVGPFGLGALESSVQWLGLFAISDARALAAPAEVGVALLLFALGLELSFERLRTMRKLIFGIGSQQLLFCSIAIALPLLAFGVPSSTAVTLALALALSSTAVGLQMLSASGRMGSQSGRTAFGVLLFQDIAIAPILLLISAGSTDDGFFTNIATSLAAIGVIVLAGRVFAKPFFLQAARTRRPELFLAASLVVLIGSASITAAAGLSPAVGGLVAGIMLAETDYRRQVEAAIAPFQGLLLGVFLIWVGMLLDLGALVDNPILIIGGVVAVVAIKAVTIYFLMRRAGRTSGIAGHVALLLAAPSETSLIVLGAAIAAGLVAGGIAEAALLITGFSLAIAPLLGLAGQWIESHYGPGRDAPLEKPDPTPDITVIIGFGRVGRLVASMLERHNKGYLAIDSDPDTVMKLRAAGKPVIYGDARRPELLDALVLETASAVVITVDAAQTVDTMVRRIRDRHPGLCVVVRARDADHASALYRAGATDAVPETVESSLQLAEAVLIDLGVPMGPVIASVHEKRAELRATIQRGMDTRSNRPFSAIGRQSDKQQAGNTVEDVPGKPGSQG